LLAECRKLGGCPTGQAKITGGHQRPARHVIHTVGPVWSGGGHGERELLAGCYRHSLELAEANGLKTIAFPAISTGVYRFPPDQAAGIAIRETRQFLEHHDSIEKAIFVCFDRTMHEVYERML
jgi:O-acetyl-ADP-ribose deacetylase (regulator of RNase III)